MTTDDSDLTAALAGDSNAFARIYDRHAPVVLSLCRRFASLDEADDAMQETFLRAYRRLGQLSQPAGFRSWLYAIARRVCAERSRTHRRRERRQQIATRLAEANFADPPGPQDVADQAEQLQRLTDAMSTLPEDERMAIHLYYLEEDPPAVAVSSLNCSRSGYYKLLNRARRRLASAMTEATLR